MTTWTFPPGQGVAKGSSIVAYGTSEVAVPDGFNAEVWPFQGTIGLPAISLSASGSGLSGCAADGSNGLWASGYDGTMYRLSSSGAVTTTQYPILNLVACTTISGTVYFLSSVGDVYFQPGQTLYGDGGVGPILGDGGVGDILLDGSNKLGSFGQEAKRLRNNNANTLLYSILPVGSQVGIMNLSGTVTTNPYPAGILTATCMAPSPSGYVIAGTTSATLPTGQSAMAFSPIEPTIMASVSSGLLTLWQLDGPNQWVVTTTLSGFSLDTDTVAWSSDGTQVLIGCPTTQVVQVVSYETGDPSIVQTLSLAGVTQLLPVQNGMLALQPTLGTVTILSSATPQWSISYSVSVPGASDMALVPGAVHPTLVVAATAGVVSIVNSSGQWVVVSTTALSFAPTQVASDVSGNVYAANSGNLVCIAPTGVAGSIVTWSGNCADLLAYRQQVVVLDSTSLLLRLYGPGSSPLMLDGYPNTFLALDGYGGQALEPDGYAGLQHFKDVSVPAGVASLFMAVQTIFATSPSETALYEFADPFNVVPVPSGVLAEWNGSAWSVQQLGVGRIPTAITVSPSQAVLAATTGNEILSWPTTDVLGAAPITLAAGQEIGVPCGIGAILDQSGTLSMPSVMSGGLATMLSPA